ncbi:krev interaction trapped protein 1 [Patella vulgata]|uniref:krev interaction trapped protein 1 n=1 Tax=Patella vulgata TaxID=6465 RepID=UPI0024A9F63A|nr:krev interaction trapped protein 1 [Patella vulgata]
MNFIREAQIQPSMTIQIYLMDKSVKLVKLPAGHHTTVQQLCELMLEEFDLPLEIYKDIFTIWTCSPSLQLQLRPEHKPTQQLKMWNRTVHMLTNSATDEEPVLKWRRNAKISVEREKKLTHPEAIKMLFHEAYDNYINAFYPCTDHDVLTFASILFCLWYGEQESSAVKSILSNDKNMKQLVPAVVLKAKGASITNKILREYNNRDQILGKERNHMTLQRKFLSKCYVLTVYGSAFFEGNLLQHKNQCRCHIGVNDVGLHIINAQTKIMIHSYSYAELKKWHEREFILEIQILKSESRHKRQQPTELKIRTKQAGLIVILMNKLNQIHFISNVR